MALEIIVETTTNPEVELEIEVVEGIDLEIDILHSGPKGLAAVVDQDANLKAELLPGDIYVVTVFDTLQQRILAPVPLTITQKILD